MDLDERTMREHAARYGIDLADEEATAYLERAREVAAELRSLPAGDPTDVPPADVCEGDDPYNAFRYRLSYADGAGDGPLSDLRAGVKDMIAVAGVPLTLGAEGVSFTPGFDATAVRRLKRAGADVVGTTNMDAYAGFPTGETCAHGAVKNPRVEGHVPGGSSAGSAAAVAADLADVALGTDTAGSVRIPASFCGVVGFKPTFGAVSRFGVGLLSPSVDHVGTFADTVENACRAIRAVAGPDPADPSTYGSGSLAGLSPCGPDAVGDCSIAVVEEAMDVAAPGVRETVEDAVAALDGQGSSVARVSVDTFAAATRALSGITRPELSRYLADDGVTYGPGAGYSESWRQFVASLRREGRYGDHDGWRERLVVHSALRAETGGELYVRAQQRRRQFVAEVRDLFEEVDALLAPTTPMTAPAAGSMTDEDDLGDIVSNTAPFNLSGHPAFSVPCGTADGRPVGLQVAADWHGEECAATVAAAVERTVG